MILYGIIVNKEGIIYEKNIKKMISGFLVLVGVITTTIPTYATNVADADYVSQNSETVNIGGYECYERDGNFWAIVDGDECLVIDVGDGENEENSLALTPYSTSDEIPLPETGWSNSRVYYVPHGTSRNDVANISSGDYCSPIFRVFPTNGDNVNNISYKLKFYFTSRTTLDITYYTYNSSGQSWSEYNDAPHQFTSSMNSCVLFVGTALRTTTAFAVKFNKDGSSSNLSTFDYTFQAKLPFI